MTSKPLSIDVGNCARCGENHTQLEFQPLKQPNENWAHWAMCPTTQEPIMLATNPINEFTSTKTQEGSVSRRALALRPDGIARRCDLLLLTPAERRLREMVDLIESLGAHPYLTDALVLMQQVRDKVADWVETQPIKPSDPYSHPDCIYNYCPYEPHCDGCRHHRS